MTKYLLNVDGQQANFDLGTPDATGAVTGTISTTEFGNGDFIGTQVGVALTGKVNLDGHTAT